MSVDSWPDRSGIEWRCAAVGHATCWINSVKNFTANSPVWLCYKKDAN